MPNNNPTGKGGFRDHPENRNPHWRKENSFSFQYARFMRMTIDELKAWADTPPNQRSVVEDLAYNRIVAEKSSLLNVKEITDRTEGKPLQKVEQKLEMQKPVIKIVFDGEEVKFSDTPDISENEKYDSNDIPPESAI